MDYMVGKTAKRIELRVLAKLFRTIFDLPASGSVDPILLLDKLHDTELFSDVDYEVVYNNALGKTVPAQCVITDTGYLIQIKESTYNGAYEKGTGGNRMHIMHEIVHHFVDKLGYKPVKNQPEETKKIPAYRSLEWIVMALAGEIMMPYEETKGLSIKELMQNYGVSEAAAKKRISY